MYEKYCKAFQEMKDKAGSYTPTENEIYQRIYPELEKYILFLLWIEMTGYSIKKEVIEGLKQVRKKGIQLFIASGRHMLELEELKLVEKEELEEE